MNGDNTKLYYISHLKSEIQRHGTRILTLLLQPLLYVKYRVHSINTYNRINIVISIGF